MPFNPFSVITSKIYILAIGFLLLAIVQTVRIDGFLFIQGYRERLSAANQTIADMKQASKEAWAKQIALNEQRRKSDTDNAEKSDEAYKHEASNANDAAIRYIDRWRVRENSCSSGPDSAAQSSNPGVPETMPADAVMVSARDVQACTGATAYAIEAHNHAVRLIESGTAE